MFKDTSDYIKGAIIVNFLSFITLPIYTRYLTPEDFGIIALGFLFGQITASVFSFGLSSATTRFFFELREKNQLDNFRLLNTTNLIFQLTIFFFIGLLIFIFSESFSIYIYKDENLKKIVFLSYVYGVLNRIYNYFLNIFIFTENPKKYLKYNITISLIIHFISIILILLFSFSFEARIYSPIFVYILFIPILLNSTKIFFHTKFKFSYLKKSLKFSYPQVPDNIIGLTNEGADKYLLGNLKSINVLGLYDLSNKFANISKVFFDSAIKTWTPFFLKNSEKNDENSKKNIVNMYNYILSFFAISSLSIIYFSEELVKLLTNEQFYEIINYIPLIGSYIFIVHSINIISKAQLVASKKLKYFIYASTTSLIINLILNISLIPKFGIYGAVFATGLSGLISSLILFYHGQKNYYLTLNYKFILFINLIYFISIFMILYLLSIEMNFLLKIIIKIIYLSLIFYLLIVMNKLNLKQVYLSFKNNIL